MTKKEKVNQGFVPDVMNRQDIISHFKDLVDIGPMLVIDWEEEINRFKKKLVKAGWGEEQINGMMQTACSQSMHLRDLPPTIRNRGNWRMWLDNKARTR